MLSYDCRKRGDFSVQKLLIADSSDIFTGALAAALQEQFEIITCANGQLLPDLLAQYRPDILVLNLMLPYQDGLTVLKQAAYHPPVILAITNHMSAYIEQSVTALGIDYTMITPSVASVVSRLQDFIHQYSIPNVSADIHSQIIHHLHLLGFSTHLDGYRQLCIALPEYASNPQQRLTKELYPAVAALFPCVDSRSVEHSIRKAIRSAWNHRDNAIWRKYFPMNANGSIPCPTNKEFICRLAEFLYTPETF